MSLWAKVQQLSEQKLQQVVYIYGDDFPIEVRQYLAQYIEEKFWSEVDAENPHQVQCLVRLVNSFIQEIERKAAVMTNDEYFWIKSKLLDTAKTYRERYSSNPMQLFTKIRQCLANEARLVQGASGGSEAEILYNIEVLQRMTQDTAKDLQRIRQERENINLQFDGYTTIIDCLQKWSSQPPNEQATVNVQTLQQQKEVLEQVLNQKKAELRQLRIQLGEKFIETYKLLTILQARVLNEELVRWKREQQLAGNGADFNSNLDSIQKWCESLAEVIWLNRQQIKEAEGLNQTLPLDEQGVTDVLTQLLDAITQLLFTLVKFTFIIEKQPAQVIKTNTSFTARVRLLVGGKLKVYMNPPRVNVTIISEAQSKMLLRNGRLVKGGDSSGEILNCTGTMEYQQASRQLSVNFKNLKLQKIKRAGEKGSETVTDEKFSLFFQSQFSIGGGEITFQVWTLSLPVVVIVHGNQEPDAWATVTWDNAFSEPCRCPFTVPDKVHWIRIADTLSTKFRASTGRSLTKDNLRFLAEKAFRGNYTETNSPMLSWAQFGKESLGEGKFSFFKWFYATMKLTREHLCGPWVDGAIMGFIRKKQAEEMLASYTRGTFLLRFSDSELGGITIAYVAVTGDVFSIEPLTSKDFASRSLADRIADLKELVYLFPGNYKEKVFGKYYTPIQDAQPKSKRPYVKLGLITILVDNTNYSNNLQKPLLECSGPSQDTSLAPTSDESVNTEATMTYPIIDYMVHSNDIVELIESMQVTELRYA